MNKVVGIPFKEGNPGRPKGAVNSLTKTFNELLRLTIEEMDGDPQTAFHTWAIQNQTEFWKIASKLIPVKIDAVIKEANYVPRREWLGEEKPIPKVIDISDDQEQSEV